MTPRAILLMVLLLLVPSMMWAESEAWVELKDGTLTFHYDENRSASTATTFDLPTTGAPGWLGKDIAHVVIDESFQAVRPTSCAQWFYNLKNLTDITGLKNLNTSEVTSMENMFALSSSLTTLDLRGLNTERVTSMKGMFNGCTSLTVIKLSTLNTSQVTNMANMFCSCTSLTMVNLSAFDTQNVTDMSQMFAMDTELTTIYASESFVTKQVTSSDNMFYGCTKLPHYDTKYVDKTNAMVNGYMKALKAQPWAEYVAEDKLLAFRYNEDFIDADNRYDLPAAGEEPGWLNEDICYASIDAAFADARPTSCSKWFYNLENLKGIYFLNYLNTSKVTDMSGMFYGCASITSLDLSQLNTENVTTMKSMFAGCSSLTELDLTSFNTAKVTDMSYMFWSCKQLTTLYLTSFSTSKVKSMENMFVLDANLSKIYVSSSFATSQVSSAEDLFSGCNSLPGYDEQATTKAKACFYPTGYFLHNNIMWAAYDATTETLTFHYDDNKASDETSTYTYDVPLTQTLPAWTDKVAGGTITVKKVAFDATFAEARPQCCLYWFAMMKDLTEVEGLENLNTSEVTSMEHMFYGCSSLMSLDLSSFSTESVTSMATMFYNCTALKELNLTSFSTAAVTNMASMFAKDATLSRIYVSDSFVTDKVTNGQGMFDECTSLPGFNADSIDVAKACFYPKGYFCSNVPQMWAAYDATIETLTFHYDTNKAFDETSTYTYDFPTEYSQSQWSKDAHDGIITVKKVVVDNSFQEARPTSCTSWFAMMEDLIEIEGLENINTSKVASFYGTFYSSSELTSLDLTSWDMSSAKVTEEMFAGCSALKNIYVSESFALPADCNDTEAMFQGCENLPSFVEDNDDGTYAHYKEGGYLTLRRHASVGNTLYNIDGYAQPTCYDDVTFTDGAAYQAPASFTFSSESKASYTRTVKNHWATLCLPFAFSAEEGTASFYAVDTYTDGNIAVKKLTGTITAGTPVLAYVTEGELNVSATGAAAVAAPATDPVLQGVFTQTAVEDADYIIANDHFWNALYLKEQNNAAQNVYVAPYRAYLTLGLSEGAKPNSISINNDVTDGINGIASAESLEDLFNGAELYDLQGRRLAAPQRGMMIIRKGGVSRKVVVR